jgi:hypothetical protein
MKDSQIPILLVGDKCALAHTLSDPLAVVAIMTPQEVISKRGGVESVAEIAISDIKNIDRSECIESALLLRNAGRTVIVCDARKVLVDLIQDLHNFTAQVKFDGEQVRTEVLLMEEAMQSFGDITDLMASFETKYIAN